MYSGLCMRSFFEFVQWLNPMFLRWSRERERANRRLVPLPLAERVRAARCDAKWSKDGGAKKGNDEASNSSTQSKPHYSRRSQSVQEIVPSNRSLKGLHSSVLDFRSATWRSAETTSRGHESDYARGQSSSSHLDDSTYLKKWPIPLSL